MASDTYTLYDLPSRTGAAWSPNSWKTRILFNFKGVKYQTKWVEYPDIGDVVGPHLEPNTSDAPWPYTIPTVNFPDGTWMQDSRKIVEVVERQHPEPSLHLDSPFQARIEDVAKRFMPAAAPVVFCQVPKRLLNDASLSYWYEERSSRAGMPLDQFEREKGGDKAYDAAGPVLKDVTAMLKENPEGPFFMGKTVSYADLVWISMLHFLKRIGDDVYDGFLGRSGEPELHTKLLEAAEPWLKRDDH